MPTVFGFDEINKLYFSTIDIPEDEKQRRERTAKRFYTLLVPFFNKLKVSYDVEPEMFAVMADVYINQLEEIYKQATLIGDFDIWGVQRSKDFAKDIIDTTVNWKRGSLNNAFKPTRAKDISLNESELMYNHKNSDNANKHGYRYHVWHSHRDEKTRKAHYVADGQIRPINEPFNIGGYKMMFPMDDSLGAPPEMIVNCRCIETFR